MPTLIVATKPMPMYWQRSAELEHYVADALWKPNEVATQQRRFSGLTQKVEQYNFHNRWAYFNSRYEFQVGIKALSERP